MPVPRLVAALLCAGLLVGTTASATAAAEQYPTEDTISAAADAGVDPLALQGAVNSTGLLPREYLYATGELRRPAPPSSGNPYLDYIRSRYPQYERRLVCIIQGIPGRISGESGWVPSARNPRPWGRSGEHASGLLQFLPSTMRSLDRPAEWVWDPYRSIDAAVEMFRRGRAGEFAGVAWGFC